MSDEKAPEELLLRTEYYAKQIRLALYNDDVNERIRFTAMWDSFRDNAVPEEHRHQIVHHYMKTWCEMDDEKSLVDLLMRAKTFGQLARIATDQNLKEVSLQIRSDWINFRKNVVPPQHRLLMVLAYHNEYHK